MTARISSLQLRTESTSVMVSWELEPSSEVDSTLTGFKLTYTAAANSSSSNSSSRVKDLAFMLDKAQRQFKIDNLPLADTRYTVCVSLMRSQAGYDKYCRDTDLIDTAVASPKKTRTKYVLF